MKESTASLVMFIVVMLSFFILEDDRYQLYGFIMLATYYITKSIEKKEE